MIIGVSWFLKRRFFVKFADWMPKNSLEMILQQIYISITDCIGWSLARIYKSCIDQRQFPLAWKQGTTILISKTKPLTWRRWGSSLLRLHKIFKKIILKKTSDLFYSRYGNVQHSFRKHASTTTAFIELTNSILSHYDNTNIFCTAIVNFDFCQAFDKVNHECCDVGRLHVGLVLLHWCDRWSQKRARSD